MLNHGSDEASSYEGVAFAVADIKKARGTTEEIPITKARKLHAINFFSNFMIHLHASQYSNEAYNSPRRTKLFSRRTTILLAYEPAHGDGKRRSYGVFWFKFT